MKNISFRSVLYFNSGALGEFLMTLFFMDSIARSPECNPHTVFYIVVRRNAEELRLFAAQYPRVRVIGMTFREIPAFAGLFVRCMSSASVVITQQTFGQIPLATKCIGRLLSLYPKSMLVGFQDGSSWNKLLYSRNIEFDTTISFYKSMIALANTIGFSVGDEKPIFRPWLDQKFLENHRLSKGKYVILAPFAASTIRSMPPSMIKKIMEFLCSLFPDATVVVTGGKNQQHAVQAVLKAFLVSHKHKHGQVRSIETKSLVQLSTLVTYAQLYVGVDTGTTHLAAMLQKPSLVLSNNSNPCWLPTYSDKTVLLSNFAVCTCDGKKGGNCRVEVDGNLYYRCLAEVSEDDIYSALRSLLPLLREPEETKVD